MDMEYYRNFIAIVEAGSLSAASKRVHVAQPALSNQLKLLQKKFGTQLVNIRRGVHNIELTNAGCILYNKAKYLCSLEDDTQREISDCVNGSASQPVAFDVDFLYSNLPQQIFQRISADQL